MAAALEFDSQGAAGTVVPDSRVPVPSSTLHVLVVDPDRATAEIVRSALDDVCVRHAPDAYCALNDVESGEVDLIVIELCLPGASALEFLRRLRARGHRVPVVVLSHARGSDAVLQALGVSDVLSKSDPSGVLRDAVRRVRDRDLGLSSPSRAAPKLRSPAPSEAANPKGDTDAPLDVHARSAGHL